MKRHELVENKVEQGDGVVLARCICGWISGWRFTEAAASAALERHFAKQRTEQDVLQRAT